MRASAFVAIAVLPLFSAEYRSGVEPWEEIGPTARMDSVLPPLFQSNEILTITISAPLRTIIQDRRDDSEEHPGTLSYGNADAGVVTVPVDIKTRGNSRLQRSICRFPPLRLDFPRKRVAGTLFEDQDKLKMVTHCQDNPDYEQSLLREYLTYRAYNVLTDLSYRVRLARITYVDTEREGEAITKFGFIIEHEDAMEARTGHALLELPVISPDAMDPAPLNVLEVFQFMIGNMDWDPFLSESGDDECCHNTQPVGESNGPAYSVPYDFDVTGLVSSRYANRLVRETLHRYGLRNVRERLYRGRCRSNEYLDATIQLFLDRKETIYMLFRTQEGIESRALERVIAYLDDFYEIIGNPGRIRRHMSGSCRNI